MTIKMYATGRGVSYDRAYRAAKTVITEAGRPMAKGSAPTRLEPDDVDAMDRFLGTVGKRGPKRKPLEIGPAAFPILKEEWLEKYRAAWEAVAGKKKILTGATIGVLTGINSEEAMSRPIPGSCVGTWIREVAEAAEVDQKTEDGGATGLLGWLKKRDF